MPKRVYWMVLQDEMTSRNIKEALEAICNAKEAKGMLECRYCLMMIYSKE